MAGDESSSMQTGSVTSAAGGWTENSTAPAAMAVKVVRIIDGSSIVFFSPTPRGGSVHVLAALTSLPHSAESGRYCFRPRHGHCFAAVPRESIVGAWEGRRWFPRHC